MARRKKRDAQDNIASALAHQLKRQSIQNHFAPIAPLSPEQVEEIHQATLTLLWEQGIEVMGEHALSAFKEAGAEVSKDGIVRVPGDLLMQLIQTAPEHITVHARNPDNNIDIGGNHINFGLVSGPPNVHDCINGRRSGNIADYKKMTQLGQAFNVIHFFGNQTLAPTDLPANSRHLDTLLINLTESDKPFASQGIGADRARHAVEMCAIAQGIDPANIDQQAIVMTNININSPRKLDDSMAYGLMQMAMLGQPTVVTPFTLMGAMTPATLAGALVQQNAEALLGVALTQIVKPGTPVICGGFTSNVDMRSGSPAFGTPENSLANMAGAQLAKHYRLPHRTSACNASNAADAQSIYETQMALWGAVMGHGNLIYHAAGWLEGGLVASFEKMVLDCEMLQSMAQILEPITINTAEIGLEAQEEVGPGGHFFGCAHTMERYKDAFYTPLISDWQNHENWQMSGAKTATERATELWQSVLKEFQAPPIEPAIKEALSDYVSRTKSQLGQDEPELVPLALR